MKGAIGSGWVATGPPAMTSGCSGPRSWLRIGIPPSSSMLRTFVKVSSYWSEKPTMSKSASGRRVSRLMSGSLCSRSFASMSGQGAKTLSRARSGWSFTTL